MCCKYQLSMFLFLSILLNAETMQQFICFVKCLVESECPVGDCNNCSQILKNVFDSCSVQRGVETLTIQRFQLDSTELYKQDRPHETELTWMKPNGTYENIYYIIQWRTQTTHLWKILPKVISTTSLTFEKYHPCQIYELRIAAISKKGMGNFTGVRTSGPGKVYWYTRPELHIFRKVIVSQEKINVTIVYTLPTDWKYPNISLNINWTGNDGCKATRIAKSRGSPPLEVYSVPHNCTGMFSFSNYTYKCSKYFQQIPSKFQGQPTSLTLEPNNCGGDILCSVEKCRHTHFCGNPMSYELSPQDPGSCLNETRMNVTLDFRYINKEESYILCQPVEIIFIIGKVDDNVTSGMSEALPMKEVIHRVTLPVRTLVATGNHISNVIVASGSKLVLVSCSIFNKSALNLTGFEMSLMRAHRAVVLVPQPNCFEEIIANVRGDNLRLTLGICIPLVAALFVFLVVIYMVYRKNWHTGITIKRMLSSSNEYQSFGASGLPDKFEIDRKLLIVNDNEMLGKGAFGKVCKGKIIGKAITSSFSHSSITIDQELAINMTVAVKQCYEYASEHSKSEFLQEIKYMKELYHNPMLINILHCITVTEPYCLIMEYCKHGDLLHYVRARRQYMTELRARGFDLSSAEVPDEVDLDMIVSFKDVASIPYQIAHGMEYISQKGYIHRDLAARNIMMVSKEKVKIGDFGLCCNVSNSDAYVAKWGRFPIKWLALEVLENYEFSTKSDVWSFGIVLFEIITLGDTPYPNVMPIDGDIRLAMLKYLKEGNRINQPPNCPDDYYQLMKSCWNEKSQDRPNFSDLKEYFRKVAVELSEGDRDYYPFSCSYIDLSKGYCNIVCDSEDNDNSNSMKPEEQCNNTTSSKTLPQTMQTQFSMLPANLSQVPTSPCTEGRTCVDSKFRLATGPFSQRPPAAVVRSSSSV